MHRGLLAVLLWIVATVGRCADWPLIRKISFAGNDTTRPSTMLREVFVEVGSPADPQRIEASRQGIQDLGLFRSVKVIQSVFDGGVELIFQVHEKYYLLPIPRVEANSDQEYGYGAQLRWSNVAGLNHRLNLLYVERKLTETYRDRQTTYGAAYSAPFVFGSPYFLRANVEHSEDSALRSGVEYLENTDTAQVLVSRRFAGTGAGSQGWRLGAGVLWSDKGTAGVNAPPAFGTATAAVVEWSYQDVRFNIYSEVGQSWGTRFEIATPGLASDYDYIRFVSSYYRGWAIGKTPHQTFNLLAEVGTFHGGTRDDEAFDLGGSSQLRGYEKDSFKGDIKYWVAGEYLRPLKWDWLRMLVVLEAGNVRADKLYVSLGLGLRVRLTHFVKLEFELGIARGLVDSTGSKSFGGGV